MSCPACHGVHGIVIDLTNGVRRHWCKRVGKTVYWRRAGVFSTDINKLR